MCSCVHSLGLAPGLCCVLLPLYLLHEMTINIFTTLLVSTENLPGISESSERGAQCLLLGASIKTEELCHM